jgi:hypothetical protein
MKQGYDYAQKKLGVEVVFGSTPTEEADVDQLQHPAELVGRRQLGGLGRHPVSGDFPQQRFNQG